MGLVDEIDALHVETVVEVYSGRVLVELLDVHDSDGRRAVISHDIRTVARVFQALPELGPAVHDGHHGASRAELVGCLVRKAEPVHDEEEACDLVFRLEVIAQVAREEERERRLAAPLGVPDDALPHPRVELLADPHGREELRIAHDVLLQEPHALLVGLLHIGDAVAQQEDEASRREDRGHDAVGGSVRLDGALVFRGTEIGCQVVVGEDEPLDRLVARLHERRHVRIVLFAEMVVGELPIRAARVIGALKLMPVRVVVPLVVGEGHDLRDVHEATVGPVRETRRHAVAFRLDAIPVVRTLRLHEGQRHAVDEKDDVGPEAVLPVGIGQLGHDMEAVIRWRVEVNQAIPVEAILQELEKGLPKIARIEGEAELTDEVGRFRHIDGTSVDLLDGLAKLSIEDVGVRVEVLVGL